MKTHRQPPEGRVAQRLGVAALVTLVTGVGLVATWVSVSQRNHEALEAEVQAITPQVAGRIHDFIGTRMIVADTLRRGLQDFGWDETEFRQQSVLLRSRFNGFLALNWISPDATIRWVTPRGPNVRAEGNSVLEHPEASPFFARARDTVADVATPPLTLFQGARGFATYLPVNVHTERGYVNGVFDIASMIAHAIDPTTLKLLRIELTDEGRPVWRSDDFDSVSDEVEGQAVISVVDRSWRLRVRPGEPMMAARGGSITSWLLGGALLIPIFAGVIVYLMLARAAENARYERAEREHAAQLADARRIEALANMASGVAHDFSNVLTAIIASVELARLEGASDASAEFLDVIESAARRGADMTQLLLSYASKSPIELRPVALPDELRSLQPVLQRMIGRGIELTLDVADGVPDINADRTELHRVVMNLVVNASDAMPEGGAIAVSARSFESAGGPSPPKGHWVELSVKDTGPGISASVKDRIFEPFVSTKGHGHGLGLATVDAAVRKFGGHMAVDSAPDEGTRFRIWLAPSKAA